MFSEETDSRHAAVDASWRVAMRVQYDTEGPNVHKAASRADEMKCVLTDTARGAEKVPVPPVLFSLPSKSAYFLLDEFNHHHQHAGE